MKHIKTLLEQASEDTITKGSFWYLDALMKCNSIANKHNVTPELVASVVAALSPRNRWARNLIDAENVVSHVFSGTPLMPCATYGAMTKKAISLCNVSLTHEERISILNGRKIQSFYCNILSKDYNRVTVDSWIDQAYSGKHKATKKRKALTLTRYKKIESDIVKLAKEKNMVPFQVQAIIWIEFQNQVKGLK